MPAVSSLRPGLSPTQRPSSGCRQGQPLPPADLPLCHFSLATYLHGPCQTSSQPHPSSKPMGPQESTLGHPDTSRLQGT